MRITRVIDDDAPTAARHIAEQQDRSFGDMISALARDALSPEAGTSLPRARNGVHLLPMKRDAMPVTLERVNQLRDEPS